VFCCVCGLSGYVNRIHPSIGTVKHYFAIFKNYFFVPVHGMENRREQKTLFFSLIWKKHDQTGKLKQAKKTGASISEKRHVSTGYKPRKYKHSRRFGYGLELTQKSALYQA